MKCLLALFFSAALAVHAGDPIVLEAPSGAKKAELDASAAALNRRFAALELKGLKATAVQKDNSGSVAVSSTVEIKDDVSAKIAVLARFAGKSGGVRPPPVLTPEEEATVVWPLDGKPGKLPKGYLFFRTVRDNFSPMTEFKIRCETPLATWAQVTVKTRDEKEWSYECSPEASKCLVAEIDKHFDAGHSSFSGFFLTIDDMSFVTQLVFQLKKSQVPLKNATFKVPSAQAAMVEAIVRNPMPFALTPPAKK
ncbi:MAG: hypothetical protein FD180_1515 [Planctomycetota bacterium]|nr:MAG: hypothetical protein FD180_1515 [Planctomycetota bacterium]